jgi:ParB family chromosome partitioning protein
MEKEKKYDTLFAINDVMDAEDNGLMMIKIDQLISFKDHIFPPYTEPEMKELMENIEDIGLLTPILVREHPVVTNKYEILSGHNRVEACRRLEIEQIHARLFTNLTEDEANLIVIETNLKQRNLETITISRRAKIVTARHNLLKKQGTRTDLLKDIENQDNRDKDGENEPFNLGKTHIWRYMRINDYLSNGLKLYLDDGKISIKSGVELSYLDAEAQKVVENVLADGVKISSSKAMLIQRKAKEEKITKEVLEELLSKKVKKVSDQKKKIKVDDIFEKYFSDKEESEIRMILELVLEE